MSQANIILHSSNEGKRDCVSKCAVKEIRQTFPTAPAIFAGSLFASVFNI